MVKLNIFPHIRAIKPIETRTFETVTEARQAMNSLDCYKHPAEVCSDQFICSNFPSLYALDCYDQRIAVEALYNARDPKWVELYRPMY